MPRRKRKKDAQKSIHTSESLGIPVLKIQPTNKTEDTNESAPEKSNLNRQCGECGLSFEKQDEIQAHLKEHVKFKPFRCALCDEVFAAVDELSTHVQGHMAEDAEEKTKFECQQCHLVFASQPSLRRHITCKHKKESVKLKPVKRLSEKKTCKLDDIYKVTSCGKYQCSQCNRVYSRVSALKNHYRIHDSDFNQLDESPKTQTSSDSINETSIDSAMPGFNTSGELEDDLEGGETEDLRDNTDYKVMSADIAPSLDEFNHEGSTEEVESLGMNDAQMESLTQPGTLSTEENADNGNKEVTLVNLASEREGAASAKASIFTCDRCPRRYKSQAALRLHLKYHIKGKTLQCNLCPKKFMQRSHLKYHLATHKHIKRYNCELCNEKFSYRSQKLRHLETHEEYVKNQSMNCIVCQTSLPSYKLLVNHYIIHQREQIVSCELCSWVSPNLMALETHHSIHHSKTKEFECSFCQRKWYSRAALEEHTKKARCGKARMMTYECRQCGYDGQNMAGLKQHIESEHGGVCTYQYQCAHCDKNFLTKKSLQDHQNKVHPEVEFGGNKTELICDVCGKKLKNSANLKSHKTLHSASIVKQFICEQCGRAFRKKSTLMRHYDTHVVREDWECKICQQKFRYQYRLKSHMMVHTGEKETYECKICGAIFTDNNRYKRHLATHPGVKPYKCDSCSEAFECWKALKKHCKEVHPKVFPCTECQMQFSSFSRLEAHLSVHSKTKDFSCMLCPKQFRTKYLLQEHIKNKHSQVQCTICHIWVANNRARIHHEKIHTDRSIKEVCQICGSGFRRPSELKRHMTCVHASERKYSCPVCKATFTMLAHCNRHVRRHSQKSQYLCTMCDKPCKNLVDFKAHLLRFHDEKTQSSSTENPVSYICRECGQAYAQLTSCKTHQDKEHPGLRESEKFQKATIIKSQYPCFNSEAIVANEDGVTFTCAFCQRRFMSVHNCQRHQVKKHSDLLGAILHFNEESNEIDTALEDAAVDGLVESNDLDQSQVSIVQSGDLVALTPTNTATNEQIEFMLVTTQQPNEMNIEQIQLSSKEAQQILSVTDLDSSHVLIDTNGTIVQKPSNILNLKVQGDSNNYVTQQCVEGSDWLAENGIKLQNAIPLAGSLVKVTQENEQLIQGSIEDAANKHESTKHEGHEGLMVEDIEGAGGTQQEVDSHESGVGKISIEEEATEGLIDTDSGHAEDHIHPGYDKKGHLAELAGDKLGDKMNQEGDKLADDKHCDTVQLVHNKQDDPLQLADDEHNDTEQPAYHIQVTDGSKVETNENRLAYACVHCGRIYETLDLIQHHSCPL